MNSWFTLHLSQTSREITESILQPVELADSDKEQISKNIPEARENAKCY